MSPVDPNSTAAFIPILMMVIVALGFAGGTLLASHYLGRRVNDPAKAAPYECGVTPVGTARERFHTRFYLVASSSCSTSRPSSSTPGCRLQAARDLRLIEMGIFIAILLAGLVYVWGKGR